MKLTIEEYLPLARRTLSDELRGNPRLRFAYLATGLYDEMLEFQRDQSVDEAGDVLWYAEQLIDEVERQGTKPVGIPLHVNSSPMQWTDMIKKGGFHLSESHLEILHASAVAAVMWVKDFARQWGGEDYTLGHIRAENIAKLRKRHPDGWSGVQS